MARIPAFERTKVEASLERKTAAAGERPITLDFMHAHRPASLPFGRPMKE